MMVRFSMDTIAAVVRMLFANIGWEVVQDEPGRLTVTDNHGHKWRMVVTQCPN